MKKYFYLATLAILAACNNQPENNNNVVVVDEVQETKRVVPEFNGTIDSVSLKKMMVNGLC